MLRVCEWLGIGEQTPTVLTYIDLLLQVISF